MRIQIWSAALAALTLIAPACSENGMVAPIAPAAPRLNHAPGHASAIRINEFHYDNTGGDVGEFVEVSGPAGTDLTGWQILLYNGSDGAVYRTDVLTGTIPNQCAGRGVVAVAYPTTTQGILQNGSPDGIALVGPAPVNQVVDFISYEGSLTATAGPAKGLTAPSIGRTEGTGTPIGHSISRSETDPDSWNEAAPNTMGACNEGNDEPPPPPPAVVIPETRFTEIHYDNIGGDGNEKIEIGGPAGTDLTGWSVVLYNGSTPYDRTPLTGVIPATCGARGVVVISYPQDGVQNGTADGFALVNASGAIVELLSYEGTITVADGSEPGRRSTDIGVSESSATPIGYSLQDNLDGRAWRTEDVPGQPSLKEGPRPATFGLCNDTREVPPLVGVVTFTGRSAFEDPPLPVGFEDQLFGTQRNPAADTIETTFTWTSETPAIASVDQDGVIRALAPGTAIFRATAVDGTTGSYVLPTRIATASATAIYDGNAEFGEPTDGDASNDFIVRRPQLISSYNKDRGTPNWVAYELEDSHFGTEDRCDCFTFDPALPAAYPTYTTADYTGAGDFHGYRIDRGHLARSADRDAGSLDNALTYYFTNIIPQASDNNTGPWAKLENHLGDLADNHNKEVYITAGVAGSRGTVKNEGKVTIPTHVWKVAVIMPRDQGIEHVDDLSDLEIVAVIMPNVAGIGADGWEKYRATVNQVEALSGYDLLALLGDEIETAVESGLQKSILQVRQLITDGTLSRGIGNSLDSKLDAAVKQFDRGNITPAVNQLEAFLRELDAMVRSNRLDAPQVAALRALVVEVIQTVSS